MKNMKIKLITLLAIGAAILQSTHALASEENTFKAIGKITESSSDHTTNHEHELRFVTLSDGEGESLKIVNSPQLLKEHCQNGKNPVVEIEGYKTGKFLFWGGDLVVTNYKVHEDIVVPKVAHVAPYMRDKFNRAKR